MQRQLIQHSIVPILVVLILFRFPMRASAGGIEFTADGTRGLGRGGAIMTRPDDPFVMARNPALLADFWGSMLYLNTHIGYPDVCSQLSGGWGWGTEDYSESVISMGPEEPPLYAGAEQGSQGGPSNGNPVDLSPSVLPYYAVPYPEICYKGGAVLTPNLILATKINDRLGVGIGFMPPELSQGNQFGNTDGTLDTAEGLRPNPMRHMGTMSSTTYFGLLGAIGYRALPWLRLGAGFRWTMIMTNITSFSNVGKDADPDSDIRVELYGQDLFIPGFTTSVHIVPIDSIDIALGFRWEDNIRTDTAKVDIIAGPFSYYSNQEDYFLYEGTTGLEEIGGMVNHIDHNREGRLSSHPIIAPQLSFGIRFADRIRPRPEEFTGLKKWNDDMRDPMADENWDVEFNLVYYVTSIFDKRMLETKELMEFNAQQAEIDPITRELEFSNATFHSGICPEEDPETGDCLTDYQLNPIPIEGKDQVSLRLGGDYNIMPNLLAMRMGVSFETAGQEPEYARPTWTLPFERWGLHTGITWRIYQRTDISIGYAHFFQETIKLAVNNERGGGIPEQGFIWKKAKNGEYTQLSEQKWHKKYHVVSEEESDGVAMNPIYSAALRVTKGEEWKYTSNAGTHSFGLDVFSISIIRHF